MVSLLLLATLGIPARFLMDSLGMDLGSHISDPYKWPQGWPFTGKTYMVSPS